MNDFELWWQDHGCRTIAYNAKDFAGAGWNGHKIHSGDALIEEDIPRPKDQPSMCIRDVRERLVEAGWIRSREEEPKQEEGAHDH